MALNLEFPQIPPLVICRQKLRIQNKPSKVDDICKYSSCEDKVENHHESKFNNVYVVNFQPV